jgi:hypothetical protein
MLHDLVKGADRDWQAQVDAWTQYNEAHRGQEVGMYPNDMHIHLSSILILLTVLAGAAQAQLYLITGSPNRQGTETFSSALLRIAEDGTAKLVAELVPKDVATELITVSYDWRKALIDSYESGSTLTVIDFDTATVVKKCKSPRVPGMGGIAAWLADSPALGPAYEGESDASPPKLPVVMGMSLNPTVPCDKSFATVDGSDIRYVVAHGQAGVADLAPSDGLHVAMRPLPAPGVIGAWVGRVIDLDYDVPADLRRGIDQFAGVIISDSHVLVLGLANTDHQRRTLLFRKSDKTWRILPTPGEHCMLRGFGRFIGMTEMQPENAHNPRSVGSEEWRKGRSRMGPDLADRFRRYRWAGGPLVFPGRLYVHDVDTARTYPITTNQADSEILLVENGVVYYRVSDRLYSAAITNKGIEAPRTIAKGDDVRDAHWAFMKH